MGRLTPLCDFDYDLPKDFIAQHPAPERDSSRLMVLSGNEVKNVCFRGAADFLAPGDCLVINATKVMPLRIYCKKATGGKVELLFLKKISRNGSPQKWTALSRDKILGKEVVFENGARASVTGKSPSGEFIVEFNGGVEAEALFESFGEMPLPPYINRKSAGADVKKRDRETYQTVYARLSGSAAAPTAGLHFTKNLLAKIREKGIEIVEIITHIGWDTFRPVKAEFAEEHKMHGEYFEVSAHAAKTINDCRKTGGRVFAVGTSVVRALESCAGENGAVSPSSGITDMFIYPGYAFKAVDAMITNFHLPKSTPYLMVCALAGREKIRNAYEEAKTLGYRFYSYGDAMLIFERPRVQMFPAD